MEQYIHMFLQYLTDKKASTNTVDAYRRDLKHFMAFVEDAKITKIEKINKTTIMSYVLYLQKKEKSTSTICRNLACIKSFYNYLFYEKLIEHNPARDIETFKITRERPRTLTQDEINRLMDEPDLKTNLGKRDRAMLELLYATGIQVTEIISIKITDVNLDTLFIACKTKGHERVIPIGKESLKALKLYLPIRHEILKEKEDSGALFLNVKGKNISRQGVFKLLREYGVQCGIESDITPKIIRHSFATHMLLNGADIKSVQEMMGHKESSTTQVYLDNRHYKLREVYAKAHPRY
jgi:integrase/recombinase XerD